MSLSLNGNYTVETALQRLLAPVGMHHEFVNAKTVSIRRMTAEEMQAAASQAGGTGNELAPIVVTGTNLIGFDPASPSIILDSEQLARRGFSSVEDVLRSLPQNLSSRTSAAAALGETEFGTRFAPITPVGNTAINLRGMGSGSTLILVNGRRRPGSAQEQGSFTDISSIPLSQIDYIEILTDGASAIYGADAVAGVVNIVLKNNFNGTTVQVRGEHSSNKAHAGQINIAHTQGWGSGSITLMAAAERSKAADLSRAVRKGPMGAGDFTADGGTNRRMLNYGAPGAVYETLPSAYPGAYPSLDANGLIGYIPSNQTGKTLTAADLLAPGSVPLRSYYQNAPIGPTLDRKSLRFEGHQDLGASLKLDFGASYTRQRNVESWHPGLQDFNVLGGGMSPYTYVPASNPNNPFGRDVAVTYSYDKEMAGLRMDNRQSQYNIDGHATLSGKVDWLGGWYFETGLNYGKESARTVALKDSVGAGFTALGPRPEAAAFYQNVNPFGNGSDPAIVAANQKLLQALTGYQETTASSKLASWDTLFRGHLFELPAGKVELAFGMQLRKEDQVFNFPLTNTRLASRNDNQAVFAEVGIPLLKDKPFAKELSLTIAARHERFRRSGNSASLNTAWIYGATPTDPNAYEPILDLMAQGGFNIATYAGGAAAGSANTTGTYSNVQVREHNTSPLARLSWRINDDFRFRATWGKSFVTPRSSQMFGLVQAVEATYVLLFNGVQLPPGVTGVVQISGPNSTLKPQVATTQTLGFDYTVTDGLTLSMTYNSIKFKNYIAPPDSFISTATIFDPATQVPPGVLTRGNNGILLWDSRDRNFLSRTSRSLDFSASYFKSTAIGDWQVIFNGTRMLDLSIQALANMPKRVISDSEYGPTKWAADLQIGFDRGPFNATIGAHYTSGHRVVDPLTAQTFGGTFAGNPNARRTAGSTTTFDAQFGYRPNSNDAWLRGLSLQFGVQNIFNRPFAFVDNYQGFLSSRSNLRGRVMYLDIKKEF